ncbi:UDP-n-acetylglucosamine--dolichyl-phosphate n-acetylglucosaminephosphotransferase-like [Plakobranchus ocellatus]|uniref:UDP-N-acetylglucosamine--dolichyl-phosphate N-acetylglucosaminephosphotransferase n=1 Tax=Plakobranchus ocellatus TaxID=259542 RepID=A0AAV4CMR6_9GAST|nr:UDP-n-acetylglucosamine--dolichyl-phosphate n-acetylglucosaminephosphotransferase-like [Plakobranchus ocellatus]
MLLSYLGDSALTMAINFGMSVGAFFLCINIIPKFKDSFISANLFGIDLNKQTKKKVPEALGVVCGAVFLCTMFLFMPVPFYKQLATNTPGKFPHHEYIHYLAALLSICCMVFLGFADDVLNLKWRHKLLLPTLASLPLLTVYFTNVNATNIILPIQLRDLLGYDLRLGPIYYIYMGMLAVFCTNAINIYAGVNGLEVGQSCVICLSVLVFNFLEVQGEHRLGHVFSIYFMMPFFAVSAALLYHNWYPSGVFVGDTYCYFAGMTFAVVAILSHFSKTMLLFFIPQVFNFLFSVPQLFHFVPCPRHRLPRLNHETGKLDMSFSMYKADSLGSVGQFFIKLFDFFKLVTIRRNVGDGGMYTEVNNLTLINLALRIFGPLHEKKLVTILLVLQVFCSIIAFFIRYHLKKIFYDS